MLENQAKLASGEGVFKGFDPTSDPAYLQYYQDNIYELGSGHRQEYEEPHYYGSYSVAHFKPLQRLVAPTNSGNEDDSREERALTVLDNELPIDNEELIGGNDEAGLNTDNGRKIRLCATERMASSSRATSKQEAGGFISLNQSPYTSSSQSTVESGGSSTSVLLPNITTKNEDGSGPGGPGASTTRSSYVPSYSAMNNAKKKKDNGKDFMRTKVKYFDDWSRRMERAPLPPCPKGSDGECTISPYKQKSAAVKALTATEYKSLIAFIATKEKALEAVEQAGNADPALYDDHGMLVVQHAGVSSKPSNQPLNTKKRGSKESSEQDEDHYSENEESDGASSAKKQYTSRYV